MATQPSKAQWKMLEDGLSGPFGDADLTVDGYRVALHKQQISPNKMEIIVYVDGWIRGEWLTRDCEERRRFLRPVQCRLWTGKSRTRLQGVSKRVRRKIGIDIDAKSISYWHGWPTFGPLRRHMARENECIEIVSINGQPCDE